jgi:hypothetical protein
MASYQDIDSRLGVVERKIDFLMTMGQVTKRTPSLVDPRGFTETSMTVLDLYHEMNRDNLDLTPAPAEESTND